MSFILFEFYWENEFTLASLSGVFSCSGKSFSRSIFMSQNYLFDLFWFVWDKPYSHLWAGPVLQLSFKSSYFKRSIAKIRKILTESDTWSPCTCNFCNSLLTGLQLMWNAVARVLAGAIKHTEFLQHWLLIILFKIQNSLLKTSPDL